MAFSISTNNLSYHCGLIPVCGLALLMKSFEIPGSGYGLNLNPTTPS
jgi:hypothetical protein